jgi:hypothetical protein
VIGARMRRHFGLVLAAALTAQGCDLLPEVERSSRDPVLADAAADAATQDACVPAMETCNELDDDCDGLVDYRVVAGRPESACLCIAADVRTQTARRDPGEPAVRASECGVSEQSMTMTFELGACSAPYPWAQCIFEHAALNQFDADHAAEGGGEGALEIQFCIDQPMNGALNLYYGEYPRRKRLHLLSADEEMNGLAAGCYRRLREPSDAECPVFSTIVSSESASALPEACRQGCERGLWSGEDDVCAFDYDSVPLYLTAEFCRPGIVGRLVRVTDLILRRHGSSCICTSDQDCRDLTKPVCDATAVLPHADCDEDAPRCGGLCIAP